MTARKPLRRANREGSIFFHQGKQRWVVQVTLPNGRLKQMLARDQDDAVVKLRTYTPPRTGSAITVADYLERWTEDLQGRVDKGSMTAQTLAWKHDVLANSVVPRLGHRTLARLDHTDIEWLLGDLAAAGYARGTIKHVRGQLALMLDRALAQKRVERNEARHAEMPAGIQPSKQKRESMTVEQSRALRDAVKGQRLEALFVTALMTGLRPGELLGLRWADVDLDAGTLAVSHALHRDGTFGDLKTEESEATLEVAAPVVEALRAHKARQATERLKASRWTDTDAVFATRVGTPTGDSNLRRLNASICKKAGLGKWTPHEYRHTAGSLLLDAGVSREEVRRVLRHKNTRMLDEIYGHEVRPTVDAAVTPMERIFG